MDGVHSAARGGGVTVLASWSLEHTGPRVRVLGGPDIQSYPVQPPLTPNLQLLSLAAMEPPSSFTADAVRDEKVKVLHSVRPLVQGDCEPPVVRAQYGPGMSEGKEVGGYLDEEGVLHTTYSNLAALQVVVTAVDEARLERVHTTTGEVLWDADTAREFDTVNGKAARGGSMDAAGPAVVNGMIFVNSGYGQWGGMPGNVFLAFSVDGK